MSYSDVYTVSYDSLDVFKTKREAQKFYTTCYHSSEGAEQQRYASILVDLNFSNLGKDNVSKNCDEIHIKVQENKDKFITIKLDDYLSIDNTIKYYEEKIKPILNISENYDVDFTEKIPFECFGSDADSYTNSSFTDYYREILENRNINIDSICTNDWSDGKYNLIVNGKDFKITAWDNLKDVIDNVDSVEEILKEKEIQAEI